MVPVPPEGEIIKWGWFQFFDARPKRVPNDRIIGHFPSATYRDTEGSNPPRSAKQSALFAFSAGNSKIVRMFAHFL
jgi:hypothetical protein